MNKRGMMEKCTCGAVLTEEEKNNTGVFEGLCAKCCSIVHGLIKYYKIPEPKPLIDEKS